MILAVAELMQALFIVVFFYTLSPALLGSLSGLVPVAPIGDGEVVGGTAGGLSPS